MRNVQLSADLKSVRNSCHVSQILPVLQFMNQVRPDTAVWELQTLNTAVATELTGKLQPQ